MPQFRPKIITKLLAQFLNIGISDKIEFFSIIMLVLKFEYQVDLTVFTSFFEISKIRKQNIFVS